jgi:predicted nucleic acid-binding protein
MLMRSALSIAAEHGIAAYDASYVAAAHRESWTLVSTAIKDLVSKGLAITPDAAV